MDPDTPENTALLDLYEWTYPWGSDLTWFASDEKGQIASFTIAGEAPIPLKIFSELDGANDLEADVLWGLEDLILASIPVSTTAEVLCEVPDPSCWIALAERGLFVYDWTDLHKSTRRRTGKYELIALPRSPISIRDVPESLFQPAALQSFGVPAFGEQYIGIGPPFIPRSTGTPPVL